MSYKLYLHPKANSFVKKLDQQIKEQIERKLKELSEKPDFFRERLKHTFYWKLRIGDYRSIYEIDETNKVILVQYIGHRKNVYDDFSKLLI